MSNSTMARISFEKYCWGKSFRMALLPFHNFFIPEGGQRNKLFGVVALLIISHGSKNATIIFWALPGVTVGTAVIEPSKRVSSVAPPITGMVSLPFTVKYPSLAVLLTKNFVPLLVIMVTSSLSFFLVKKLSTDAALLDMEIISRFFHLESFLVSAPKLYALALTRESLPYSVVGFLMSSTTNDEFKVEFELSMPKTYLPESASNEEDTKVTTLLLLVNCSIGMATAVSVSCTSPLIAVTSWRAPSSSVMPKKLREYFLPSM